MLFSDLSKVTVLLPAYNEEAAIGHTINDVKHFVPGAAIIVVDNNCTDSTVNIARSEGVEVITCLAQGKGNAIRSAIGAINTPYCVMMDSDFTYPAKHIPEIVTELERDADVVLGCRAIREQGSMTWVNLVGNRCLSLLASMLYWRRIGDMCTGMWGFRINALRGTTITSNGFTLEAEMLVGAIRNRCRIAQMPIEYRARLDGSHPKLRVRNGLGIGWFLIRERLLGRLIS